MVDGLVVSLGLVVEWITKDGIFDESAPPKLRTAYFFDVDDDGSRVTLRGLIHRDDADPVLAVLAVAAELGAVGKVLLDHGLDPNSGMRIELAKGKMTSREGRVKMPPGVVDEIDRESTARARRLGREEHVPLPSRRRARRRRRERERRPRAERPDDGSSGVRGLAPCPIKTVRRQMATEVTRVPR